MSRTGRDVKATPPSPATLAGLGVTEPEEQLYRALLRHGTTTISQLAQAVALRADRVRGLVAHLVELGLVVRLPGSPVRLVPAPPEAAIEALAARRLGELNHSRTAAAALVEEAAYGANSRPEELVELITGREAVAQRYLHLFTTAQEELCCLVLPPFAVEASSPVSNEALALDRGVRLRTIYDPATLRRPEVLGRMTRSVALGEDARIGEVPLKLLVVDRRSGMLPLTQDGVVDSCLVVHSSALLDALVALFEGLWRSAVPLPTVPQGSSVQHAARSNQVLALLTAGATDETIARQIGVSARTVQRHIRAICEDLGAVTRFQAGLKVGRGLSAMREEVH